MATWESLLQRPPEPVQPVNPMQLQQQALTLKQLGGQIAINQQVQQENQLKLQSMQEDQNDQATIQNEYKKYALANPGKPIDPTEIGAAIAPQVRLRNYQLYQDAVQKQSKAIQDLAASKSATDKQNIENLKNHYDIAGDAIEGIMTATDPQVQSAKWIRAKQTLRAAGFPVDQLPDQLPDHDTLMSYAADVGHKRGILDTGLAGAKTQEAQTEAKQKATDLARQDYQTNVTDDPSYQQWRQVHPEVAATSPPNYDAEWGKRFVLAGVPPKEQPEYGIKNIQLAGMNQTPEQRNAFIDSQISPVNYPDENKQAKAAVANVVSQGHPENAQAEIDKVIEPIRVSERERDPRNIQARINQKVGEQIALARLSPDAFAPIQDPRARAQAELDYKKSSEEAADKISDAQRIKDFVTASQSGNKAAPGMIPVVELRGILNRVNRNELQQVGTGAGDLKDKLEGFWGKWTEGQPIAPDILRDTSKVADLMDTAARRTYDLKLRVNRGTYGSKVQPIDLPAARVVPPEVKSALGAASVKPGIHKLSDGSIWMKAVDGTISPQ